MCFKVLLALLSLLFLITHFASGLQEDYYWREYTGNIPYDAIVGGKDINGDDIHIGQAPIRNQGAIPVSIHPGIREVYAPLYGVQKVAKYAKILCGAQQNFHWISANASHLHTKLIGETAVIGGFAFSFGYINVGRINYQGEIKIGKVDGFTVGNAQMYFVGDGAERSSISYEVLVYRNKQFLNEM